MYLNLTGFGFGTRRINGRMGIRRVCAQSVISRYFCLLIRFKRDASPLGSLLHLWGRDRA